MRALLSVFDKTGIVEFARDLSEAGCELVSSGGTARVLEEAGLVVTDVAKHTGYPAMLGHRVVTLHPKVHGGILADRLDPEHVADLEKYEIPTIDLVVANLYPFASDPSIELIDIGGPAMVRAAAKNHQFVGIAVDPGDYPEIVAEIAGSGRLSDGLRLRLARKAFAHTAAYDAEILRWFDGQLAGSEVGAGAVASADASADASVATTELPERIELLVERKDILRYGENPHQVGGRYSFGNSIWDRCKQLQGKELSYLNVFDADAAWRLVWSLHDGPTAVVIKHGNPCGAAVAADLLSAYERAHAGDPISAFGGIVAVNRPFGVAEAERLIEVFTEVLVVPEIDEVALAVLSTKPNLRVLVMEAPHAPEWSYRQIDGGLLVQTPDLILKTRGEWTVATERHPSEGEWADLELAWKLVAQVTSNTIVLVKDGHAVGIGAGQQNRRDAGRIAADKADGRAVGGACASDAFFPFRDGLDAAIAAGATAVIQPGGSIRDEEVIAAANDAGLAMVFTGERHFKH
ncbi:MAG TPA: bifunctional phosphoribosylaminoimidazolecarboxamide formyltransferase/IMP cyclohydrolase PurH [Acidimicrobiaceae bacterium]|nr:bifunctional phosphoribosylaminoimidazolecarboxamide formyltransferase/IMP cyclohydrolase PurH [Acidimicrobiaceae bacterium]